MATRRSRQKHFYDLSRQKRRDPLTRMSLGISEIEARATIGAGLTHNEIVLMKKLHVRMGFLLIEQGGAL